MREVNTQGPPPLGPLHDPPALPVEDFQKLRDEGAIVLDCRTAEAFASHIPEALNVGLGSSFPTWAGTILPPDRPILLVLDDPADLWDVCWHLLRVGYELPRGWLAGGMMAWRVAGKPLAMLPQWTVFDLHKRLSGANDVTVLDVRQPQEWSMGHIKDAVHVTGAELPERTDAVPQGGTVAVVCGSGYRSSVCSSLLTHRGHKNVVNVLGGMNGWKHAGFEVVRE